MNRAQRRAKNKKKGKKQTNKVEDKMGMFDLLPTSCSSCAAAYDKKDRNMVMTWNVVVREKEKIVRLYCPKCRNAAKQVISKSRGSKSAE